MSNKPLLENWVIVVDNSENKIHYEKKDVVEAKGNFEKNVDDLLDYFNQPEEKK